MTAKIIPFDYQGRAVRFDVDGWLHATEIAERFGKEPHEWLRLPDTASYLAAISKTGKFPELVRTKRGRYGGTWLHSKLAVVFARWLSVDFAVWCDEQIDALLRGGQGNWQQARLQSAIGYRGLCDALAISCEERGKAPQRHHFINEARLINQVITGQFSGRDRDQLSAQELLLVSLIEIRDVMLIGQGKDFNTRKEALLHYIQSLRAKHLGRDVA